MKNPLILVSNDDGFRSEGIQALTKAMQGLGQVIVVAPDSEQSAASHALTLHRPLRVYKHSDSIYSVDGTPTDCVTLAIHEILKKKPDFVVSGINRGANLGDDVHYSGTVSAAVEGALSKIPSVAFSLVSWGQEKPIFNSAAHYAKKIMKKVIQEGLPRGVTLNVNIPNLPLKQIKGISFAKLGKRNYEEVIFEKIDPRGRKYFWIGGDDRTFDDIPTSDGNMIQKKMVSITPLQTDMTHYLQLEEMKGWKF
ncbi:MAG: 5'/3'-nucleotidase SurE [Deltaproteobacteria bacterium]|nr:MAG: 5'/3'-nucleotidase SurE [Deltaproteobacteria bacterium]